MIRPADIRQKAERRFFTFLEAKAAGEDLFPMRIPARMPSATKSYSELQSWLEALIRQSKLRKGWGYTVVIPEASRTVRHGAQSLPSAILIETQEDFLRLTGNSEKFAAWESAMEVIRTAGPGLWEWAVSHPRKVLAHVREWPQLLLVVDYFRRHPRPGLYMRDLPLELDTKFVENRKKILRELLELSLPREAVDPEARDFAGRFGLRKSPFMVRFRLLDPELRRDTGLPAEDLALPVEAFAALPLTPALVIVSENLAPFLSLPRIPGAVAIWGEGASVGGVQAPWLEGRAIRYWGDLDVQGMQFLARFRRNYPQTKSLMMDRATLDAHAQYAVEGTPDHQPVPEPLTPDERILYESLRDENLRLEQERVTYFWREDAVRKLTDGNASREQRLP